MASPYHRGERAVQERAGLVEQADINTRAIHPTIPDGAAAFLAERSMLAVASRDLAGGMWASLLTGRPGFARVLDDSTLEVDREPIPEDPLAANVVEGGEIGLLAIDFATRRRLRVNGTVGPGGGFVVDVRQFVANCPKYITVRRPVESAAGTTRQRVDGTELTAAQRDWIAGADTFFMASASAEGGADVSHRGGNPGFVEVPAPGRLVWPDYSGNAMFLTLGNLELDPSAGLVFAHWGNGATLQLSGRARVDWSPAHAATRAGAERLVVFDIDHVVETSGALDERYGPGSLSRFNP